jgi:hypothetical protein
MNAVFRATLTWPAKFRLNPPEKIAFPWTKVHGLAVIFGRLFADNFIMKSVLVLGLFILGCQSAPSREPVALFRAPRCPAGEASCGELLKVPEKIAEISIPSPEGLPISPITERVVRNLKLLEVPYIFRKYEQPDAPEIATELTFTQFLEAYKTLPGGAELIEILQDPHVRSGQEIKEKLKAWMARRMPGYSLVWNPPGETTDVEEEAFFDMLRSRRIPIANHHDILVHLFLFCDPEIRGLTERIARLFFKGFQYNLDLKHRTPGVDYEIIANAFWVKLQENTPVLYRGSGGEKRIAIIGGFPSIVDPIQAYVGSLLEWVYMVDMWTRMYSKIELDFKTRPNVKDKEKIEGLYKQIMKMTAKAMGLAEDTDPKKIGSAMDQAIDVIDGDFRELSRRNSSYQERWREFSHRVLEDQGPPQLKVLKPEFHRKILKLSVELLEALLDGYE